MRIALAGAGGTGKGTLGAGLAEALQLPFLPSPIKEMGEYLFGMDSYHAIDKNNMELTFQYSILASQISQEKAALICSPQGYVSERSSLDYIPFFLNRQLLNGDTNRYVMAAHQWAKDYDVIIYTPADFVPADKDTSIWKQRDLEEREQTDLILQDALYACNNNVFTVHGSPKERLNQAFDYAMSLRRQNLSPNTFYTK